MVNRKVFLTGASGYVGRNLAIALHREGYEVTCVARRIERCPKRACSKVVQADLRTPGPWVDTLPGHDAVLHLVGIIREDPRQGITFQTVHVEITERLLAAAEQAGVRRWLQMSALGADREVTQYQKTKKRAEERVQSSPFSWTIFRPSVIFGRGDVLTGMIRRMMAWTRVFPYFTGPDSFELQPVHIDNVVQGFVKALSNPETVGQIFEVAGPEVIPYRDFLRIVRQTVPGPVLLMPFPGAWMLRLTRVFQHLPGWPMTEEQFIMLAQGNTTPHWQRYFEVFQIEPISFRAYMSKSVGGNNGDHTDP